MRSSEADSTGEAASSPQKRGNREKKNAKKLGSVIQNYLEGVSKTRAPREATMVAQTEPVKGPFAETRLDDPNKSSAENTRPSVELQIESVKPKKRKRTHR